MTAPLRTIKANLFDWNISKQNNNMIHKRDYVWQEIRQGIVFYNCYLSVENILQVLQERENGAE